MKKDSRKTHEEISQKSFEGELVPTKRTISLAVTADTHRDNQLLNPHKTYGQRIKEFELASNRPFGEVDFSNCKHLTNAPSDIRYTQNTDATISFANCKTFFDNESQNQITP